MTNNSVDNTDPFGFSVDTLDISTDNPGRSATAPNPVLHGSFGNVTGSIIARRHHRHPQARRQPERQGPGLPHRFVRATPAPSSPPAPSAAAGWRSGATAPRSTTAPASPATPSTTAGTTRPAPTRPSPSTPPSGSRAARGGSRRRRRHGGGGTCTAAPAARQPRLRVRRHLLVRDQRCDHQLQRRGRRAPARTRPGWTATAPRHTDTLSQSVTDPGRLHRGRRSASTCTSTPPRPSTSTAYDTLKAQVLNGSGTVLATLATYSNLNAASGYTQRTFDLSALRRPDRHREVHRHRGLHAADVVRHRRHGAQRELTSRPAGPRGRREAPAGAAPGGRPQPGRLRGAAGPNSHQTALPSPRGSTPQRAASASIISSPRPDVAASPRGAAPRPRAGAVLHRQPDPADRPGQHLQRDTAPPSVCSTTLHEEFARGEFDVVGEVGQPPCGEGLAQGERGSGQPLGVGLVDITVDAGRARGARVGVAAQDQQRHVSNT